MGVSLIVIVSIAFLYYTERRRLLSSSLPPIACIDLHLLYLIVLLRITGTFHGSNVFQTKCWGTSVHGGSLVGERCSVHFSRYAWHQKGLAQFSDSSFVSHRVCTAYRSAQCLF